MTSRSKQTKVILVTGATDGIGKQTALELLRHGHHVIVHGRSEERVAATCSELGRAVADARIDTAVFDLASLAAVRSGAERLLAEQPKLHVLINNAGTFVHERRLSVD